MSEADPDSVRPPADAPPRQSDLRDLEPAASGRRISATTPDAERLDALLALSLALPVEAGPRAVVSTAVAALGELLPGRAIGLCVIGPDAERIVERSPPEASDGPPPNDSGRLFAELAHEHATTLPGEIAGSLHVGHRDAPPASEQEAELGLIDRAARVIAAALARSQAFARALDANRELRRLQAQVIQAEKLASLGQIMAGVVHELNNPLTSIVAYSDWLDKRARARGDEDDRERLRRIGEAADRILKFSRDLVAYARPAAEAPSAVSLTEVIDKALVFCEHEFAESSVEVDRRLTANLPLVHGIAGQLTQVFVNLFTNASHAMSASGGVLVVEATSSPEGQELTVAVSDHGTGIDQDALELIFEPFFTTKSAGRGTGLGLSIVRDIVDAHGGTLSVESQLGRGSTFWIRLPASPGKPHPPDETSE